MNIATLLKQVSMFDIHRERIVIADIKNSVDKSRIETVKQSEKLINCFKTNQKMFQTSPNAMLLY